MYPLREQVEVGAWTDGGVDRFGNPKPGELIWESVNVFGYATVRTQEEQGDSIMRLVDELQVFAPPGTFDPAQELRLPDGTKWTVEGNAEDYNANPWFKPGLVVIHCKRVEG